MVTHIVRRIFRTARPTNFKLGVRMEAVMLTRTFHQGVGAGPGQGLHFQGPGQGPEFEYKNQKNKDKDLSKCGHITVNIPGI